MIIENGSYYLYRHIRLDKNEPFYVGIGKKDPRYKDCESIYKRALTIYNRSSYWKNIVNKHGYSIDIILESNDLSFIKQKEIEFITLYGRQDLGKGTLVNFTDGGDGLNGLKHSEETRKKMSLSAIGIRPSEETKQKIRISKKKDILNTQRLIELSKIPKTEEYKQKIRESLSKYFTPEVRAKISEQRKNISEETRQKMSLAKQNMSSETKNKMKEGKRGSFKPITNFVTNQDYESIMDCVRKTGWSKGKVYYKLKNNQELKFKQL